MKERLTRREFLCGVLEFGGASVILRACRREEITPELTPKTTLFPSSTSEETRAILETPGVSKVLGKETPELEITVPLGTSEPIPGLATPGKLPKDKSPTPPPISLESSPEKVKEVNLFTEIVLPALKNKTEERRNERSKDPEFEKRVDKELNRERINFLFLSTGSEEDEETGEVGFLTDSIQLISLDTEEGNFDILTFHRDVEAPEVARFLKRETLYRLNATFKVGGFPLTRKIIEDATGLSVDFALVMKMEVLKDLAGEAFGGWLEINLPWEIDDVNMGYFPKGKQILDGEETLRLARARFYASNYERNLVQQAIIKAILTRFEKESFFGKGLIVKRLVWFFEKETASFRIKTDFDRSFFLSLGTQIIKEVLEEKPSPFKKYKFGLPEVDSAFVFAEQTGMLEPAGDPKDEHRLKVKGGDPKADPLEYWFLFRFKTKEFLAPTLLTEQERRRGFALSLQEILPSKPQVLSQKEELAVEKLVREKLSIKASFTLEGKRLPRVYGLMGTEQHLLRYPGDKASDHEEFVDEGIRYIPGAYGYFAKSRQALTPKLEKMEKYYVSVQTWSAQDSRQEFTNDQEKIEHFWEWFRFRKMLVVNPENGKAVVAIVADAGPALWTGKDFGGSPEVMDCLGLKVGPEKGKVLLFFVDDLKDEFPLGSLEKF